MRIALIAPLGRLKNMYQVLNKRANAILCGKLQTMQESSDAEKLQILSLQKRRLAKIDNNAITSRDSTYERVRTSFQSGGHVISFSLRRFWRRQSVFPDVFILSALAIEDGRAASESCLFAAAKWPRRQPHRLR